MVIGIKDLTKLFSITIVICCAVFVCTLFLNYNMDLAGIKDEITTPGERVMYEAQAATGKVVVGVTGGALVATTVILLIFYLKNYIDSHARDLGILKALGYSNFHIAKYFRIFGVSVLIGSALGFAGAACYMPTFYKVQNSQELLPTLSPQFQPLLCVSLLALPTVFFTLLSVLYAFFKLKMPVLSLLKETPNTKIKVHQKETKERPFLQDLRKTTLRSRKTPVFFVGFSAFCFSAMIQMSASMKDLASEDFSWIMLSIGLILAFMTLLMSLTSVLKANSKTIAMMKVLGYSKKECGSAILGGYRPISYIGFALGTFYQYFLLRIMVDIVFADYENMPVFRFNRKRMILTFLLFLIVYEAIIYYYAKKIERQSVKEIMSE